MDVQICRHIKANGEQCGSPRLRSADYCYFHNRNLARHREAVRGRHSTEVMLPIIDRNGALLGMEPAPQQTLELGLLEDRTSVQMAISTVLNALAAGRLEQRRATALLYGLQLASSNCPASHHNHGYADDPIEEVVDTPDGLTLAPADRIPPSTLLHHQLLNQLQSDMTDDEDDVEGDEMEAEADISA